jgi:hypothetical protein
MKKFVYVFLLVFLLVGCKEFWHPEGPAGGDTTYIAAPTGVYAIALSSSSISISWSSVSGATGYYVYRATSSLGTYSKVTSSLVTGTSYTNSSLSSSTTYYYKVSAYNSSYGETALSSYAYATTSATSNGNIAEYYGTWNGHSEGYWDNVITINENAIVSQGYYNNTISNLTWTPYTLYNSDDVNHNGYRITGTSTGGFHVFYAVLLDENTIHCLHQSGEYTPISNGARWYEGHYTKQGTSISLSAPTGLTATAGSSSNIQLSWSSVSGATGYYVYRATSSSGTYSKVTSSLVTGTSYTNSSLSSSTTYYYKVSAYNSSSGETVLSPYAYATTSSSGSGSTTTLTPGSWTTSSITSGTKTFTIPATSSSRTVTVYWLDWNHYTIFADIKVQLGSGSTYDDTPHSGFNGVSCNSAPYFLSAGETGTITVSLNRSGYAYTGSFQIGYQ